MSSPPSSFAASSAQSDIDAPVSKLYFCHQCNRTVTVVLPPSSDPICPHCNEGFLEELENPEPVPDPFSAAGGLRFPAVADPFSSFLPFLFPSSSSPFDLQDPPAFFSSHHPSSDNPHAGQEFNPMIFLHNHLNNLRSSGAQVQFVIENRGGGGGPFPSPVGDLGDYFIGPGFEQLIQQLAENDPNRYGTPPASKSATENLPTVTVTEDLTNSDNNQCAVCQDDFEIGMEVKQMPCKHVYHADCLLPWLELHNSCPVCRHELPTDDSEYESRKDGGRGGGGGGGGGGDGSGGVGGNSSGSGGSGERMVRRSFSIMLPFPFSSGGSVQGN